MEQNHVFSSTSYLLARLCHAHRQNLSRRLSEMDLHAGQEIFLFHLYQNPGQTQSELAQAVAVQPATVTRVIQRMEKSGLVSRRRDPEDRRVVHLYLTEAGRALEQPLLDLWEEVEQTMLEGLDVDERKAVRSLLLQLLKNVGGDMPLHAKHFVA